MPAHPLSLAVLVALAAFALGAHAPSQPSWAHAPSIVLDTSTEEQAVLSLAPPFEFATAGAVHRLDDVAGAAVLEVAYVERSRDLYLLTRSGLLRWGGEGDAVRVAVPGGERTFYRMLWSSCGVILFEAEPSSGVREDGTMWVVSHVAVHVTWLALDEVTATMAPLRPHVFGGLPQVADTAMFLAAGDDGALVLTLRGTRVRIDRDAPGRDPGAPSIFAGRGDDRAAERRGFRHWHITNPRVHLVPRGALDAAPVVAARPLSTVVPWRVTWLVTASSESAQSMPPGVERLELAGRDLELGPADAALVQVGPLLVVVGHGSSKLVRDGEAIPLPHEAAEGGVPYASAGAIFRLVGGG